MSSHSEFGIDSEYKDLDYTPQDHLNVTIETNIAYWCQ